MKPLSLTLQEVPNTFELHLRYENTLKPQYYFLYKRLIV